MNVWSRTGVDFFQQELSLNEQIMVLEPAIYELNFDPKIGLYLTKIKDKFDFPYKIYGMESKFIDWVLKTYENTNSNLGILLNGVKGTGKTVTAEMVCNRLNQPVIIMSRNLPGIPQFINNFEQNIVLLFDEYEKIFNPQQRRMEIGELGEGHVDILTLMDGVLNNQHRKTFLLTTNIARVNENMMCRPGRLRYIKTFGNLSLEAILEIIDDKLKYPELKDGIVDFISKLELITVDIVKSIIDEANIHQADPNDFKDFFNVQISDELFNVFKVEKGKKTKAFDSVQVLPKYFTKEQVGSYVRIGDHIEYLIEEVIGMDDVVVIVDHDHKKGKPILAHFHIEKVQPRHASFKEYTF
jgi:hypothetical protein